MRYLNRDLFKITGLWITFCLILVFPAVWLCIELGDSGWEILLRRIATIFLALISTWMLSITGLWVYDMIESFKSGTSELPPWFLFRIFILYYFGLIISYTAIYTLVFRYLPGNFKLIEPTTFHWTDIFFLSAYTITKGDYSLIKPVSSFAKTLSLLEFVSGIFLIILWLGWNLSYPKGKQ